MIGFWCLKIDNYHTMDHVAEIKNRIPIEDLVSQYVQLKKVGRNFKGLCPFHSERSPSFYVSTEKQLAYCFGCRKGGDHFKFIQEIEGIDFVEALKMLAEKARVELPTVSHEQREKIRVQKSAKDRIIEMHEIAQSFFEEQLWSPPGSHALSYIRARGVSDDTIKNFHLGYAPAQGSSDAMFRLLIKEGFSKDECEQSGLVLSRNTDNSVHFDRFRNRLMFPISTPLGKVCAFGGRALSKEDEPKYLNSPETPIYHKSDILYGFFEAKNAIRTAGSVVFVEGYMDMIAAYQSGVQNVVATSGTALTNEHLELIKRHSDLLTFSFDADSAGRQATLRAFDLALPLGFTISVAVWDDTAKDPDEMCAKNPQKYIDATKKPQPMSEFLIDYFASVYGTERLDQRVTAAQALVAFIARVQSPLFVDEWIKQASIKLSVSVDALYGELQQYKKTQKKSSQFKMASKSDDSATSTNSQNDKNNDRQLQKSEYLLGLLLTYQSTISLINQMVQPEIFLDPELKSVYRWLLDQYNQCSGGQNEATEAMKSRVQMLMLYVEQMQSDAERTLSEHDAAQEVVAIALQLARSYVTKQKSQYLNNLRTAPTKELKEQILAEYEHLLSYEHRLSIHT